MSHLKQLIEQYKKILNELPNDKKDGMRILWGYIEQTLEDYSFSDKELQDVKMEIARVDLKQKRYDLDAEELSHKAAEKIGLQFWNKLDNFSKVAYNNPRWTGFFLLVLGRKQIDFANKFKIGINNSSPRESTE